MNKHRSINIAFIILAFALAGCSHPVSRGRGGGDIDVNESIRSAIVDLPDSRVAPAAIKVLVEIGPPAASPLIAALGSPDETMRENAAAALRRILADHPSAAPNRESMATWLGRTAEVDRYFFLDPYNSLLSARRSGFFNQGLQIAYPDADPDVTLGHILKILLPNSSPMELEWTDRSSRFRDIWEGGISWGPAPIAAYRLDDYTTVRMRVDGNVVSRRPVISLYEPRVVTLDPPANYSGAWTLYYVSGQAYATQRLVSGKLEGKCTQFSPEGVVESESLWHGDRRISWSPK